MAAISRTIRVRFDGDAKGIGNAVGSGTRDLRRFGKQIQKFNDDLGEKSGLSFSGSFGDALKTSLKRSVPSFMSDFGSTFTSGLKGVLSSPIVGPIIVAALAGAAIAASGAVATIAGAAIVSGIAAGLIGLGVIVLAQNEKIKKQFSTTFSEIKDILADAAEPLIPVLDTVRSVLTGLAKEFGPALKNGFRIVQGPLKGFFKDLGRAFEELKPVIEPVMEAFSNILRSIGPQLPGLFRSLASSVGSLARTVGDNSDVIAALFTVIVKGVEFAINAIDFLIKALRGIIEVTFPVADAFLDFADTILGALQSVANALAAIPGPWQATFKKVSGAIGNARTTIQGWRKDVQAAPKVIALRGDIRDLDNKIARAKAQLKDPNLTKERRAKLNADIRELQRKRRIAQQEINSLTGKTVTIRVRTERQEFAARLSQRATGGSVTSGRTYLVGERGPELLTMGARNGQIIPNNKIGSGGGDVEVKVFIGDQELRGMIRTEVSERDRGLKRRALAYA